MQYSASCFGKTPRKYKALILSIDNSLCFADNESINLSGTVMEFFERLSLELQNKVKQQKEAEASLQATSEFQLLSKIQEEIKEIEGRIQVEIKTLIQESGFEARVGHTTGSTNHRDWQSSSGEPWTFVIVHKDRPKIKHIGETSRKLEISCVVESIDFSEDWILGSGETEEDAWEEAIEEWKNNSKLVASALEGL